MPEAELDLDGINFGGGPPKEDPKPKTNARKSTGNPVGRPGRDAKLRELNIEIEGFLKLANLGLMSKDLHEVYDERTEELLGYQTCLSVYVETDNKGLPKITPEGKAFVTALANIVIDNSFLMKLLDSGDKAGKWLSLAMALQPLVLTVISNHSFGRRNDAIPAQVSE